MRVLYAKEDAFGIIINTKKAYNLFELYALEKIVFEFILLKFILIRFHKISFQLLSFWIFNGIF